METVLLREELPKHVGIIMDGNGRWAKKRGLPRSVGHKEGSKRVREIVIHARKLGIPHLSLYAFSTENWKRPMEEISKLMELLGFYIKNNLQELVDNGIRLNIMGDITPFPAKLKKQLENALFQTRLNDKMILNIGLNYGGQDEILRAVRKLGHKIKAGELDPEAISLSDFSRLLDTGDQPPLDLLIRPSGELRVSNFMLFQLAYAEFWFSKCLWPDFTPELFNLALADFQNRNRRFGGLS